MRRIAQARIERNKRKLVTNTVRKPTLGNSRRKWRDYNCLHLKHLSYILDCIGSAQVTVAGSYKAGNEFSCLMKSRELFRERKEWPLSLKRRNLLLEIS
jgi:hypothetical protein